MKKIGLLLVSSTIVIIHAQQASSVIVNFITINNVQANTKSSLSTSIANPDHKSEKRSCELNMFSHVAQKENVQDVASSNWLEIMEIVPNKFITYDDKRTSRYVWESKNKPGNCVDFVQTYWPPSQWHGTRLNPWCVVYINDLKNKEVYDEFEQDACCHLVKFQNENIEFLCAADKSFLEKAGFVRQGGFLSKEISPKVMAALASRR